MSRHSFCVIYIYIFYTHCARKSRRFCLGVLLWSSLHSNVFVYLSAFLTVLAQEANNDPMLNTLFSENTSQRSKKAILCVCVPCIYKLSRTTNCKLLYKSFPPPPACCLANCDYATLTMMREKEAQKVANSHLGTKRCTCRVLVH